MKKQQSGFTMIELIMVIVILGILAAFALPRFANFGTDARIAAMQGALGAVKSASSIAHAQALVKAPVDNKIQLEGADVVMVGTYPAANKAGIGAAAQLSETDFSLTDAASGVGTFTVADKTKANCSFTYSIAAEVNGVQAAPVFVSTDLTVANCN